MPDKEQIVAMQRTEQHMEKLRNDLRRTSLEFLTADLNLAITLARVASKSAGDRARKQRNQQMSRRAYDSVMQLMTRLKLSPDDRRQLHKKITRLRSMLRSLGETF